MVNEFYSGIGKRIEELFTEEERMTPVYFDELPQGFTAPCFFIKLLNTSLDLKLWNRYEFVTDFDVVYYPLKTPESDSDELNSVGYRLMLGMEYIEARGGYFRGTGLRYTVNDGVLHFFVSYHCFILKNGENSSLMMKLLQKYGLK